MAFREVAAPEASQSHLGTYSKEQQAFRLPNWKPAVSSPGWLTSTPEFIGSLLQVLDWSKSTLRCAGLEFPRRTQTYYFYQECQPNLGT